MSVSASLPLRDPVRPIRPDDAERIVRFHDRQSPESIYFRFFSPRPRLSERDVGRFTHVDYVDRMAFVGLIGDELVGVARYDRHRARSDAEVAFFIDDEHHGRGIATVLLEYLAVAAREAGISGFTASVLPQNRKMLGVFTQAGFQATSHFDGGIIEVELGIGEAGGKRAVEEAQPGVALRHARLHRDLGELHRAEPREHRLHGVVGTGAHSTRGHDEAGADELLIHGRGLHGWQEPSLPLDCVTSGTTMRLLAGLVAGAGIFAVLSGGPQLSRRPMGRVAEPLRKMGAIVLGRQRGTLPPLASQGGNLRGIDYRLPIASAQVKSAILLAGLFTHDLTVVVEPGPSRDHTERMLRAMGAPVHTLGAKITSEAPTTPLQPLDLRVPADMSSAAFLLTAAVLVPGSVITLEDVVLNPTRRGLFDILRRMGADLRISEETEVCGEPVGHITARPGPLTATTVAGEMVVRAIDELPVLAVAATQALSLIHISEPTRPY